MNKYETVILLSSEITNGQRSIIFNKIKDLISQNGTIESSQEIGEKKLAYEVRGQEKAFYYIINFESESSFIPELERNYRIIDEVLKFIVIRNDD